MIFWNLLFFNREGYYCDCYYADIINTFVVNSILCNQDCDQNCSKQSSEIFCEKCGSYDGFYGNKYMLKVLIFNSLNCFLLFFFKFLEFSFSKMRFYN